MIKLLLKIYIISLLFVVSSAQATLITGSLTEDNYISYKGIDFAWVSPVSYQFYYQNELFAPDALRVADGWRYATDEELTIIMQELTLDDFTAYDQFNVKYYIQAVEYWNTELTNIDIDDFELGKINSNWEISGTLKWDFETFYVRSSNVGNNGSTPVPEPSTLMIFALGLIALACKKRLFK